MKIIIWSSTTMPAIKIKETEIKNESQFLKLVQEFISTPEIIFTSGNTGKVIFDSDIKDYIMPDFSRAVLEIRTTKKISGKTEYKAKVCLAASTDWGEINSLFVNKAKELAFATMNTNGNFKIKDKNDFENPYDMVFIYKVVDGDCTTKTKLCLWHI